MGDPRGKTDRLERGRGFKAAKRYDRALKGFAATLSPGQVQALRDDPEVDFVSPDRPVQTQGIVPVSVNDTPPPGVRRIEAGTTDTTREASTANVAVIDTGIDLDHPDLNVANGVNCVGSGPAEDENGHGTHVAGTVAARNNGAGLTGVAPGTRVYAAKVLDASGNGSFSQIICAIDWVTATRSDADPANDIAVANMSLAGQGGPVGSCASTTDALHRAICASTAAGAASIDDDAEARTLGTGGYGFNGDPVRPVSGRTYGYLSWAAYKTANGPIKARYTALSPGRILDTRSGNGALAARPGRHDRAADHGSGCGTHPGGCRRWS